MWLSPASSSVVVKLPTIAPAEFSSISLADSAMAVGASLMSLTVIVKLELLPATGQGVEL